MNETNAARSQPSTDNAPRVIVAMPVFNDWRALTALLTRLDAVLFDHGLRADVLVIDDGSTDAAPAQFTERPLIAIAGITLLTLRCNLGHQRAIAVGLAYIERNLPCEAVILMDADGEDSPADLPRLVSRYNAEGRTAVVFAERRKRVESVLFRVLYHAYRALHRVLIGHGVRVGNFSIIPRVRLQALVTVSELWNHYAAAVFRSRQPFVTVPTARAPRLHGQSRMSFVALVVHGMRAISVYDDVVFVRSIMGASVLIALALAGLATVVAVRLFTDLAVPGWATFTSGLLVVVLLQGLMFIALLTFLGLRGRQQTSFIPSRDFAHYVGSVRVVSPSAPIVQIS